MQVVHLNFIDDAMKNNDELTAPDLQRLLFDRFGLSVSVATVKRHRYAIGWVIREANRNARLLWCQQMLLDGESFDDVIWSDETIIYLDSHAKVCFRKRWQVQEVNMQLTCGYQKADHTVPPQSPG
ncbi:hypothetical protein Bbelb_278280 [Branchiostoma belcheri]|nr:hypothetical protein Bbelb_278280 [Branchiostoma belcheri]